MRQSTKKKKKKKTIQRLESAKESENPHLNCLINKTYEVDEMLNIHVLIKLCANQNDNLIVKLF